MSSEPSDTIAANDSDSPLRSDANRCFVCGQGNDIGLHLHFSMSGDVCVSEFTPSDNHCGYDGVTHGGLIFAALDDVMANWIFLQGLRAYTAKCDIRYRDSLPTGTKVLLEGRCIKQKGRLTVMQGKMIRADNQAVVAETEARFMMAVD